MKLGVLGGTFDPVHLGHLKMAEAAKNALGLERVLLVPAGQPLTRVNQQVSPAGQRLEMLRLAVQDRPGLEVSPIEIERPGPTYTIDTLAALKTQFGKETEIYFILGWDSLAQLPGWRHPALLVNMCRIVAVPRPGYSKPDMDALEGRISGLKNSVIFLEQPYIDISATEIRKMAANGETIDRLVPAPVAEYIKKHNMYLKTGGKP
jgi:nicotinate-nucleotide adenylyltransferase